MKFNSQICTTKEQSERLLALGLKRETADMSIITNAVDYDGVKYSLTPYNEVNHPRAFGAIPAWSLHRLIQMMPSFIEVDKKPFDLEFQIAQGKLVLYESIIDNSVGFVWGHGNLYESMISCIEQLIKENYFNKEYLN